MSLKTITQLITGLAIFTLLVMASTPLIAEEADKRSSKTISFAQSDELDKTTKDELLKQADTEVMAPLNKDDTKTVSNIKASHTSSGSYSDITIYDAATDLISDINYDGFYHRFSVAIDVDTIYDTSYVYARLHLSLEGGPWNHYATSQNYHIYGDSQTDIFVIETELADGFPPGYYDIKIDLYDADTGQWLLNYGPYEDTSLSNLPLEDSYYDDFYDDGGFPIETEIVVAGHAGSLGWWLLMLPALIVSNRRFNK